MNTNTRSGRLRVLLAGGTTIALAITTLVAGTSVYAAALATVGLGTAGSFAVLAGTPHITNTGPTTVTGNLGIHPAEAVTGFPPGTVSGTIHAADAVALQAKADLGIAYDDAAGRPATATHATLGGLSLAPGVYNAGGATLDLTGTLTLDGQDDPNAVWIFQATSDLVTASSSSVRLVNGGQACNVFWQVTSSATLGSGSTFEGTILALTSITIDSGVTVHGRVLARNGTVTLINDTITRAVCAPSAPGATSAPSATPRATSAPRVTTPPTDVVAPVADRAPGAPAALLGGILVVAFVVALGLAFALLARRPTRAMRTGGTAPVQRRR